MSRGEPRHAGTELWLRNRLQHDTGIQSGRSGTSGTSPLRYGNAINVAMRGHARVRIDRWTNAAKGSRFGEGLCAWKFHQSASPLELLGRQRRQTLAGTQRYGESLSRAGRIHIQKLLIRRPTQQRPDRDRRRSITSATADPTSYQGA
jgi:hypothetical protein